MRSDLTSFINSAWFSKIELITLDISICPIIPEINLRKEQKAKETKKLILCLPPAYEIVLEFQYEGSSYLRVWISERNQEFHQECVEKAEV